METILERTRSALEATAFRAVRAKLGEGIRSRYDLAQPLPERLHQLVKELRGRADQSERQGSSGRTQQDGVRIFPSRFP
jgi:hypothetical protein